MNEMKILREVLYQWGFVDAAQDPYLRVGPDALRSWENYPQCMEIYPTYLEHKRDEEGNIID